MMDGSTSETQRTGARLPVFTSDTCDAELDEMTELDAGDPEDLGARVGALRQRLPMLNVLGGCCGTDHRHLASIAAACCDC